MADILVLAEQQFGKLAKASLHAIGAAKQLAQKTGGTFEVAVAGSGIDAVAGELTGYGATGVVVLEHERLASVNVGPQ